jgi:hypothetical protein
MKKEKLQIRKIYPLIFTFYFLLFTFLCPICVKADFYLNTFSISSASNNDDYLPGEMLIKLKDNEKIYKIKYQDKPDLIKIQQIVLSQPEVEYAEPNYLVRAAFIPNDPYLIEQWPINKMQVPQAWDIKPGGSPEVVVAVLDSGVDIDHPDLKDNIYLNSQEIVGDGLDNDNNGYIDDYFGWDFVRQDPNPKPKFDEPYNSGAIHHGTVVAGIIAAVGNNGIGVTGLAWRTKIMALRVLNSEGVGSVEAVIRAINYAIAKKVDVINLSFVGSTRSEFLAQTLKQAWQAGIFITAAAGNETTGQAKDLDLQPVYPACSDVGDPENYIFTVAATNQEDKKALFSNYGKFCVDLSAPGTRIFGLLAYQADRPGFGEYYGGYWSGTSLAAPFVSGTVALIRAINPFLTNNKIRDILKEQSDNIDEFNSEYIGKLGAGRLNVYRAVNYAYSLSLGSSYSNYILTGAGSGGGPHLRFFKANGQPAGGFFAYDRKFSGGVRVATGDTDGDNIPEIITGAGPGGGPHVRIFDNQGNIKSQFFVYNKKYSGGLNVASCDLDRNGIAEIIIGLGSGAPPYVYVFNQYGDLFFKFLAYSYSFRGGVSVACGDTDGDNIPEIITGAGPGGGPHVRIFDNQGILKSHFFAFLQKFRGGINVGVGDLNGDGRSEIVVGIASGASPYVRIFDFFGTLKAQFLAYEKDFYGGVNLFVGDLNDDLWAEIIVAPVKNHESIVRVFDNSGGLLYQFLAYDARFKGGASLTTLRRP